MTDLDRQDAAAAAHPAAPGMHRRSVLTGGLAVGAAGLLAACGSDSEAQPSDPGSADAAPPESGAPDAGGGSEVLAAVADVPVGGGVIVAGVVVTQPVEGEFRAFSSTCTHQSCQVSSVSDGTIDCACHGSRFSVEDGSVQQGPATAPLPEVGVEVSGSDVVRS